LTREQARMEINSCISELPKAKKRVGGRDTYICPFCGNGSGPDGDGISTKDGTHYKCFKCGEYGDYLHILKKLNRTEDETDIFDRYGFNIDSGSSASSIRSIMRTPQRGQLQPTPQTDTIPKVDHTKYFQQAQVALQNSPEGLAYLKSRGISEVARFIGFSRLCSMKFVSSIY